MKTAAAVLQEMMVQLHRTPDYKCISQTGAPHMSIFEFECRAMGLSVTATANSKKDAKQEVARQMLLELANRGYTVPAPYGLQQPSRDFKKAPPATSAASMDTELPSDARSYVALLKELGDQYRLPMADYELVGHTGPAHMRQFTIKAVLGAHERFATAATKKAAKQLAAQKLYDSVKANLEQTVRDYGETMEWQTDIIDLQQSGAGVLVSASDKAFERYMVVRQESAWKPDLGQRMSTHHSSLFSHIDPLPSEISRVSDSETRQATMRAISSLEQPPAQRRRAFVELAELKRAVEEASSKSGSSDQEETILDYSDAEEALPTIAQSLGLRVKYETMPSVKDRLHVVELTPTMPEVALVGWSKLEAATRALEFIQSALKATGEPMLDARIGNIKSQKVKASF